MRARPHPSASSFLAGLAAAACIFLGLAMAATAQPAPSHALPAAAGLDRWTPLGPEGGAVTAFAADPGSPDTLYAGAEGGIWKSTDGGGHWRLISQDLQRPAPGNSLLTVQSLTVDPGTPGRVFALTNHGAFRSPDGGAHWHRILSSLGDAWPLPLTLAVSPIDPDIVLANVGQYVLRSNDGGEHWVAVLARPGSAGISLTFNPADPSTVYVTLDRVFRSTNAGITWKVQDTWPVGEIFLLDPTDPRTLYVTSYGSLWKSIDAGASWMQFHLPENYYFQALAVDPADPSILVAGTSRGLLRSEDAGESWQIVPDTPAVLSLAADPARSGTMWLGSDRQGVLRSVDSGRTWEPGRQGLTAASFGTVAFDPFDPGILYAAEDNAYHPGGGNGGAAFRSTDRGATWSRIDPESSEGLRSLAPDPLREGILFAGGNTGGIFRSTSRGISWEQFPQDGGDFSSSLAFDPRRRGTLFAGGYNGIARSDDGGRTWEELEASNGIIQVSVSPLHPDKVLAVTENGSLLRSSNQGETWQYVQVSRSFVLASHPTIAGRHYLADSEGAIWRSADDGASWRKISRKAAGGAPPTALRVDRRDPSTLYLGTSGNGVWRSTDGGATWKPLNTGMVAPWITCLDADPRNHRHLIACTRGGGLMEIRLSH